MLQFEPTSGALGATVIGIDLCRPIDDVLFRELNEALLVYEVLFFRNQPMSPQNHADLAGLFGAPQVHGAYPHVDNFSQITILENDAAKPSKIKVWHTDMTFCARPPLGSILHGISIPKQGGDTLFASLSASYEGLSGQMQSFLSGLTAIHDFSFGFQESLAEPGGWEAMGQMVADNPPVEHPVIRTHPLSGRKGLFVNALFTKNIRGMKPKESRALLDFLFDHMVTPEYTCRFNWLPDSVAFWDNRVTMHKPVNDYWPQHRKLQRITIAGDRPQ